MSAYGHGRHEHGQNFLTNHKIINSIIDLVKQTSGPIIEIGPGSGALTHPMAHLGRAITAVEVDAKLAAKITQETSSAAVEVVHDDFLNFRLPATPCVIVGNIPFHLTTRDRGNSPKGRVVFITFRNTIMVALARNRPRDPTSQIAHQRLDRSLPGDWFLSTSPSTHFTIGK